MEKITHKNPSDTPALEANLLGVPLCVLNQRSAFTQDELTTEWNVDGKKAKFTFRRVGSCPFPLPQHAKILDCLITRFAANFREDGLLFFTFAEVMNDCGLAIGGGSRSSIREAIDRYQNSHCRWEGSFKLEQRTETWTGSIIGMSSFSLQGESANSIEIDEAGGSRLNWVKFHEMIGISLKAKEIRLILRKALQEMPADTYILYRWLRRFTDKSEIKRRLPTIKKAVNSQLRPDKFKTWLIKKLEWLHEKKYISAYQIDEDLLTLSVNGPKKQRLASDPKFELLQQHLTPSGEIKVD